MAREVIDGDTFKAKVEGEEVIIRLAGVGAPEIGEPGADEATEKLKELLGDGTVKFKKHSVDPYGRLVCSVTNSDGVDVNAEMKKYLGKYLGR